MPVRIDSRVPTATFVAKLTTVMVGQSRTKPNPDWP